jgi:hypothetical protein
VTTQINSAIVSAIMALALVISFNVFLATLLEIWARGGDFWCISFRVHPGLSPSRLETLVGCFVLIVLCESLIVDP